MPEFAAAVFVSGVVGRTVVVVSSEGMGSFVIPARIGCVFMKVCNDFFMVNMYLYSIIYFKDVSYI